MNQFIFKSRWIAIAFTVLTLFSVYTLVGDEDDGLLGTVQGGVIEQRDEAAAQLAQVGSVSESAPPPAPPEMMDDTEFVDDAELLDDASGIDPSPEGEDYGSDEGTDSGDGIEYVNGVPVMNGDSGSSEESYDE